MKTPKILLAILVSSIPALLLCCMGGTSETGNSRAMITGSVTDGGTATSEAQVRLVAEAYVPGGYSTDEVFSATTDQDGRYRFEEVPKGTYYLNARKAGKRYLSGPVEVVESEETLPVATLRKTSQVTITIPETTTIAFVFIQGTVESWSLSSGEIVLDSVPAGTVTVVGVKTTGSNAALNEKNSVTMNLDVQPEDRSVASFGNKPPRFVLPVASVPSSFVIKDETYTFTASAVDPENRTVRYRIITGPQGMSIDSVTGVVTWKVGATVASGNYVYTVTATDDGGASQTASFSVEVADVMNIVLGEFDSIVGLQGRLYVVRIEDTLFEGVNVFRLAWGDGDTSTWLKTLEAAHQWAVTGSYELTYQMQFKDGEFSPWYGGIATIIISGSAVTADILPPVITVAPDTIMVLDSISLDYYHRYFPKNYRAFDLVDGDLTAKVSATTYPVVPGDSSMGYTTYTVQDAAGNSAAVRQWIFLPPAFSSSTVITLAGSDSMSIPVGGPWVEPGFAASDISEGDITDRVQVDSSYLIKNLSKPGTYHVFYSVPIGGTILVIKQRTVIVINVTTDTIPPVIILRGNNPDTVEVGSDSIYRDPGFTVKTIDTEDVTGKIVKTGMVNMFKVGTYTLTYSIMDIVGNNATATRTVHVVNNTIVEPVPPVITLLGNTSDTVPLWQNPDDTEYNEPGYTALDAKDGDITSKVVVTGTVDINVPGTCILTYFVRDADSNTTTVRRSVEVLTWARYPETLIKYEVPTGKPLPDRATVYRSGESYGLGRPDLTVLSGMRFSWVAGENTLSIVLEVIAGIDTLPVTINTSRQVLGSSDCAILVQGSGIEGLDGPYYVRVDGTTMYWVSFERDMVILWNE